MNVSSTALQVIALTPKVQEILQVKTVLLEKTSVHSTHNKIHMLPGKSFLSFGEQMRIKFSRFHLRGIMAILASYALLCENKKINK